MTKINCSNILKEDLSYCVEDILKVIFENNIKIQYHKIRNDRKKTFYRAKCFYLWDEKIRLTAEPRILEIFLSSSFYNEIQISTDLF